MLDGIRAAGGCGIGDRDGGGEHGHDDDAGDDDNNDGGDERWR